MKFFIENIYLSGDKSQQRHGETEGRRRKLGRVERSRGGENVWEQEERTPAAEQQAEVQQAK